MKPHHTFLIALGIATPLWLRQRQFERQATAALIRQAEAWNVEIGRAFKQHERVWKQTVKDIEGAFRGAAR